VKDVIKPVEKTRLRVGEMGPLPQLLRIALIVCLVMPPLVLSDLSVWIANGMEM
jgi:hypothetical protein